MDYQLMEQLLEKYFEGETSLAEEARLREFFQQEEVPEALRPYQGPFRYYGEERNAKLGDGFDQQVLSQLEAQPVAKIRRLGARRWVMRIAAVLVLGLGLWWAYFNQQPEVAQQAAIDWSKYEVQSPEEAFQLTSAALLKTSLELNQGASTAAREMDKLKNVGKFFK